MLLWLLRFTYLQGWYTYLRMLECGTAGVRMVRWAIGIRAGAGRGAPVVVARSCSALNPLKRVCVDGSERGGLGMRLGKQDKDNDSEHVAWRVTVTDPTAACPMNIPQRLRDIFCPG